MNGSPRAVTIIGAGTQGRRLAYMWTACGNDVHLVDQKQRQLDDALEFIECLRVAQRREHRGRVTTEVVISDIARALRDSWLVIETIPERLSAKRQLIADIDAATPPDTLIASNSSSYTVAEIIENLNLTNESRVLSAHCYWPPETRAIEIMGHKGTDIVWIEKMMIMCKAHGFEPFHVKQNSIGYIYNRIWAAIKRESLLVAAEGVATPEEVDNIFKSVLGARSGPFAQMDVVGLDVVLDIEEHYAATRFGVPMLPRTYLKNIIAGGKLGVKSGSGFFDYAKH